MHRPGAIRLRHDDDLRVSIDRRYAGVALDDALARRHCRAVVVRPIALPDGALWPAPLLGMRGEAAAQFRHMALQPCDASGSHQLLRLPHRLRARPTPLLARMTPRLHAIDGEHLTADQPVAVAEHHDRREDGRDLVADGAHEMRDRREVWRRSPQRAINVSCSVQARAIARLLTISRA